ncbi:MAG: hypothetical protein HOM11_15515, partial [Methylococcales bacterium]|nr:hypothetical protein [Methylococcales bacterium]
MRLFLFFISLLLLSACSSTPRWTNEEKGMRHFNKDNKLCRASAVRRVEKDERKAKLKVPIFQKDEKANGRAAALGANSSKVNAIRDACLKRRGYEPIV